MRRLSGLQWNIRASSHKELLEQSVVADISADLSQCEEWHQHDEDDHPVMSGAHRHDCNRKYDKSSNLPGLCKSGMEKNGNQGVSSAIGES